MQKFYKYCTVEDIYVGIGISGHGKNEALRRICENSVIENIETMPMVKTMLGALEANGCKVDLDRHLMCDICKPGE